MTLDFAAYSSVRARVQTAGRKCTAQLPITASWDTVPPTLRRWAMGRVRAMLHHEGALCVRCASALAGGLTRPCHICAPVQMTLVSDGVEYPLIEGDLFAFDPPTRRLLLVATQPGARDRWASRLEVDAAEWAEHGPAEWNQLMQRVVGGLAGDGEDDFDATVRTFIWDGEREIPFPRPTRPRRPAISTGRLCP
ncbi:hypothetical protein ACWGH2_42090 [Streptomyces sp. NPDC054871]